MATLPDFLTDQTEEVIMQRMLNNIPADLDKSEGGYIWDSLNPVAIELAQAYIYAQQVLERGFVATTFGEYLDLKVSEDGLERKTAVESTGEVTFTGTPGTNIPAYTRVATSADGNTSSIEFETQSDATIGDNGSVTVVILAVEAGKKGDVPTGAINIMVKPLSGVSSVANETATSGGLDEEDDDLLKERDFEECKKEEGDGNLADYEVWAKEVSGVGNVLVEPLWQGDGTVRVVILDPDGRDAPQATVDAVQNHLDPGSTGRGEGKAPIGARVTVVTATIKSISATIPGLLPETGYALEQAQINAESALRNYLKKVNPGGTIRIREAESEIINAPGVLDMGNLLIDGANNNITLEVTELADLGSVNYV